MKRYRRTLEFAVAVMQVGQTKNPAAKVLGERNVMKKNHYGSRRRHGRREVLGVVKESERGLGNEKKEERQRTPKVLKLKSGTGRKTGEVYVEFGRSRIRHVSIQKRRTKKKNKWS